MPRISDTITLGEGLRAFKAIVPQNGNTPAKFREQNPAKGLTGLALLNVGVSEDTSAGRPCIKTKTSIVYPHLDEKNVVVSTSRFDIATRIDRVVTSAEVAIMRSELIALIKSPEFAAALTGEQQY